MCVDLERFEEKFWMEIFPQGQRKRIRDAPNVGINGDGMQGDVGRRKPSPGHVHNSGFHPQAVHN